MTGVFVCFQDALEQNTVFVNEQAFVRVSDLSALFEAFLSDYGLLQELATIEHSQWMNWSKAIADSERISLARLERWRTLWVPFGLLPDEALESDFVWVNVVTSKLKEKFKEQVRVSCFL